MLQVQDTNASSVITATDSVVLPSPSINNPVPALPAALRVDNYEQLLQLLQNDPHNVGTFRQCLVFGTESLRTLLLRNVLSDPHTRTFKGKKKNWDAAGSFPIPTTNVNITSTHVLQDQIINNDGSSLETTTFGDGGAEVSLRASGQDVDVVTYFLHASDLRQTKQAVHHIHTTFKASMRIHHRLVYLPQPSAIIYKLLQQLNVVDNGGATVPNISVQALPLDLFPLETDIISLECNSTGIDSASANSPSMLVTTVARSLLKLQDVVGRIPRIQSYGPLGEQVLGKLLDMTLDEHVALQRQGGDDQNDIGNDPVMVEAMVLMDRRCDLVTPMLTPLTYEGLLDDVVGIDCGFIHVQANTINPEEDEDDNKDGVKAKSAKEKKAQAEEIVALGVNGSDSLYAEVRNQHVEKFGSFLQNQAMALRESHANFTSKGKNKDLSEIHQFVKQIPVFTQNLRSLTNHIHLAELVKNTSEDVLFRERWQTERAMLEGETCYDTLEDLCASQHPPFRFFRLMCLQSLCSGGIKSSRYDSLRRDVVQTYGYEYLFVLQNLEKSGLLRRREGLWMDSASSFYNLRKSLILINAEVDTVDPDDISYVSSGYAPLSVRVIQTAVKGWQHREEILRDLPGRFLDILQTNKPQDLATALKQSVPSKLAPPVSDSKSKPTLAVVYIGGITYMEIAALRFLSKRPTFPYRIIVVTTKILNGSSLLRSVSIE